MVRILHTNVKPRNLPMSCYGSAEINDTITSLKKLYARTITQTDESDIKRLLIDLENPSQHCPFLEFTKPLHCTGTLLYHEVGKIDSEWDNTPSLKSWKISSTADVGDQNVKNRSQRTIKRYFIRLV